MIKNLLFSRLSTRDFSGTNNYLTKNFVKSFTRASLFAFLFILCGLNGAFAQFTITENFKGSNATGVTRGDNASLTSGTLDPVNDGWLRLTSATGNQKGYAYVNKSFPSTLGVLVDFEYKTWRNVADNTYNGADGIGVFLFDANNFCSRRIWGIIGLCTNNKFYKFWFSWWICGYRY